MKRQASPAPDGPGAPPALVLPTSLSFVVPGSPVPKARPRVVQHGRERVQGFTPAKTKTWEQMVGLYALQARQRVASWPLGGRYAVTLEVIRSDARGDLDNMVKSALDGCNSILWNDDGQVDGIQAWRRSLDAQGPRLVMLVAVIGRAGG